MSALRYSEFKPHPALASYVLGYWEYAAGDDIEPFEQHVMPDGRVPTIRSAAAAAESAVEAAAIFDRILLRLTDAAAPIDHAVRRCAMTITSKGGHISISTVADLVGLSERQLQRRFRRATGITPKQVARIRRLRNSVSAAFDDHDPSWSRLAADQDCADHAQARTFPISESVTLERLASGQ